MDAERKTDWRQRVKAESESDDVMEAGTDNVNSNVFFF